MDNSATIRRFAEAVLGGDLETAGQLLHPGFVLRQPPSLPYGGEHHGTAGFVAMLSGMQLAWRQLAIRQLDLIGDPTGETFALHMQVEGLTEAGEPLSSEVFERWVVRDGQIAGITPFYWDTAMLAGQLRRDPQ